MLRIYISYAPADKAYLATLLEWLQPLKQKYFLRIWHNPIPVPGSKLPYAWDDMLDQLEEAHIYLFLTSYHALGTNYIEQEEIPRAVARQIKHGDAYVRIFPVLLSPSQWKKFSGLASHKPIGLPLPLSEIKPVENGYMLLVEQLEQAVVQLRRNWMEEYRRLGKPLDEFNQAALPPPKTPEIKPIPGWAGVALLFALFYMITSWYYSGCAPRMYFMYTPESVPYQPLPDRYLRENPIRPPTDVPPPPPDDTVGRRIPVTD